jgi:hypothetical protein
MRLSDRPVRARWIPIICLSIIMTRSAHLQVKRGGEEDSECGWSRRDLRRYIVSDDDESGLIRDGRRGMSDRIGLICYDV